MPRRYLADPAVPAPENLRVRGRRGRRRVSIDQRELVRLDGRTKLGRAAETFHAELTAHVGGAPTAVQTALIEQAVQLRTRLAVMDARFAEADGAMSVHDSRMYLAWSNSLTRLLRELGVGAAARDRAPSLAEILAGAAPGVPETALTPPHGAPMAAPSAPAAAVGPAAPGKSPAGTHAARPRRSGGQFAPRPA